ncbi:hypothetical protein HYR54_10955 [Candidatus Acetothermia bacterium]|nr:hypothetical protein [Candidatus Acetothermia bacterium]MBI3460824.1 hypothetical protein [Candidatus Acetothermia bacterium]MBI3659416.1 hypothetical protein [Candidatus Acetothermia bacterium]
MPRKKHLEPIPDEFDSYEEAAEFWDNHNTTDYPDAFQPVKAITEFRRRHYEIEIDEDVAKVLHTRARRRGLTVSQVASELLRDRLAKSKVRGD